MGASVAWLKAPWQPGQSGNPAGRPKGARSKLEELFLVDMLEHWREHGKMAISEACRIDPVGYIKTVGSILRGRIDPESLVSDLSRDELRSAITTLQSLLAAGAMPGARGAESEPGPAD